MWKKLLLAIIIMIMAMVWAPSTYAGTDANPGDIVINEIMRDPDAVSDANGEWFEIKNVTTGDIDINGWTIKDDGIDLHVINNGSPLIVPADGYLVLCRNADTATNGGVSCDYEYSSFVLANSADEVVIFDDGVIPQEIDRVNYDASFPSPVGASIAYGGPPDTTTDPSVDNDNGARWGTSTSVYGLGDKGTPGTKNDDVLGPNAIQFAGMRASTGPSPTLLVTWLLGLMALLGGGFWLRRLSARIHHAKASMTTREEA